MHKKRPLFFVQTMLLVLISYYFLDREMLFFLTSMQTHHWLVFNLFAYIPDVIRGLIFIFYIYFSIRILKLSISFFDKKCLVACNATVIALFLKEGLKAMCGREWPGSYQGNSFLISNEYGFNWFMNFTSSFPSGHATLIFAFSVSMFYLFPAWRWVWGLLCALTIIGQLGMHYHFLSDLVAGGLLGSVVAMANYRYSLMKGIVCS